MHVAGGPETITATDAAATLTAATLTAAALREKCVHIGGKVASRVKRIELDVDGEGGGRQERGEGGTVQASSACKTRSYTLELRGNVYFLVTSDSSTVRTVGPTVPYYVVKLLGIVLHNRSKF